MQSQLIYHNIVFVSFLMHVIPFVFKGNACNEILKLPDRFRTFLLNFGDSMDCEI
jgi:hypothetical protein